MQITELLGKTLVSVAVKVGEEEVLFKTMTGEQYKLYHDQSCCESVSVYDICGDLRDLVGSPLLQAEESSSDENPPDSVARDDKYWQRGFGDSYTWTFYRLATVKGAIVLRWYGESNGHYSERVDFKKVEDAR